MNCITIDPIQFIHGAVSCSFDEQQYCKPTRFSAAQLEEYMKNDGFNIRAHSAAGMSIDMQTDGNGIEFMFKLEPDDSVDFYSFDLTVNGRLFAHRSGKVSETPEGSFSSALPAGDKLVRIYLPCLAQCSLGRFNISEATYCRKILRKKRVLFMGDSITQGYTLEFPSMSFPAIVTRALDADLLNQGVGYEVFHPEIAYEPCGWNPTYLVVCYGTNEWSLKSKEEFIDDSIAFYANLRRSYPNTPIAVVSPIWRADKYTRREDNMFPFEEVDELIAKAIDKYEEMFLIHGKKLYPEIPELMRDSNIHPNDIGNVIYADRLYSLLPNSWK